MDSTGLDQKAIGCHKDGEKSSKLCVLICATVSPNLLRSTNHGIATSQQYPLVIALTVPV
jgi:hypothetical protein